MFEQARWEKNTGLSSIGLFPRRNYHVECIFLSLIAFGLLEQGPGNLYAPVKKEKKNDIQVHQQVFEMCLDPRQETPPPPFLKKPASALSPESHPQLQHFILQFHYSV